MQASYDGGLKGDTKYIQNGGDSMEPVYTSYSSYTDVTYRKCTPEELRDTTLKSMTAFAEAVGTAAAKAVAADK